MQKILSICKEKDCLWQKWFRYVLIDEQCNARKVVLESAKSWPFVAQSATIDLYKVDEISKEVQSDFDGDVPLCLKDCQKIQAA